MMLTYIYGTMWFGGITSIAMELGIFYEIFKIFSEPDYANSPMPKVIVPLELIIFATATMLYVTMELCKERYEIQEEEEE